jgi:hypothetical protein
MSQRAQRMLSAKGFDMWPRDAYVGQRVVALKTSQSVNSKEQLTKDVVYTILDITIHYGYVYIGLVEIPGHTVHSDLLRPVDETKLDVFRSMLKNVPNGKNVEREHALQS